MSIKTSQLSLASTLTGSEFIRVIQDGDDAKATVDMVVAEEATARAAADTTLQTNITTEATTRATNDTNNFNTLNTRIGTLASLTTTDKTSTVAAINEHDVEIGVISTLTTTFKTNLTGAINELDAEHGVLASLTTTAKNTFVAAINELDAEHGVLASLTTTAQNTFVASINELDGEIGVLSSLTTTAQNTIVAAINEVNAGLAFTPGDGTSSIFQKDGDNAATGDYSVALGIGTTAARYAELAKGSGPAYVEGTRTNWSILTAIRSTTNSTVSTMFLDGSSERITIPANAAASFRISVVAVQVSGSAGAAGDSANWVVSGFIKNVAGTTTLVGDVNEEFFVSDDDASTWAVAVSADDTNDALHIEVTGQTNKNIAWLASIELTENMFDV